MITLSVTVEGDKQMSRTLLVFSDNIKDFREPLSNSEKEVTRSIDQNFASRGSLFGAPWAERKDDNPWPILEKTGTMRNNFKNDLHPDYVRIFNPTPYFPYHTSKAPRGNLPRRIMMKLDDPRKIFIVKEFQRWVHGLKRKRS